MIRVSSFDIFDTCLTRTFAYPVDLFVEVGVVAKKNGWISITSRRFAELRGAAEETTRKRLPSREPTFAQIYEQLGVDLGIAPEMMEKIVNAELLIESQSLRPIDGTLHRIEEARRQGRRIMFLSDMYLPVRFLEELLRKFGFYRDGDFLLVSNDVGFHKGDGKLFQHAQSLLENPEVEWIHLGDSMFSDVEAPRRLGLGAEHFAPGALNRYELKVCPGLNFRHSPRTARTIPRIPEGEIWESRLGAAMRLARLAKPRELSPHESFIWDTASDIAGPLFYGYVKWILDQAGKRGLSRLYFIARDGQILLKIAGIIQSSGQNPIDCRYLYGSRRALLPASLQEIDAIHLQWILATTANLSVNNVFARLEIAPEKYRALLESSGFSQGSWNDALDSSQLKRLSGVLRAPDLSAEIKTIASAKREELLRYLRKEGFFEQGEVGVVDLGWRGSLAQALIEVCKHAPDAIKPGITGFHFALVNSPHLHKENFLGYVNALRPASLGEFLFYMQLLEAFAAADHGQVYGYRQGDPVLASSDNPAVSTWGLSALQGGILAFCRAYAAVDDSSYSADDYLRITLPVLKLFYEEPTRDEVEAWGAFPFSDQQVESSLVTLLPAWNKKQTMAALLTRDGRKRLWWVPALAKRERMKSVQFYYRLQKLWRTRLKPRSP
jgi:HAD superfamily hydrolase (TIGR01549 family)